MDTTCTAAPPGSSPPSRPGAPRPGRVPLRAAAAGLPVSFILIWSSGYLVGDIGTNSLPPFTLLWWRFAVAGLAALVVALIGRARWPRRPRQWLHLMIIGILLHTVQFGGVYVGMSIGAPAGLSALLVGTSPLVIALVGTFAFNERMSRVQWVGLLLGVVGVAAAVQSQLGGGVPTLAILAVLVGLAGMIAGTLYQKHYGPPVDVRCGLTIQMFAALVTTTTATAVNGGFEPPSGTEEITTVLWLAIVCSLGGFGLLFALLRRRSGGAATSYLFLVPPVTALIAVPLLSEPVSTGMLVGIAVAACGVTLVTRQPTPTKNAIRHVRNSRRH
ncbi:DMT family transporter [Pseudonocardia sp. CA-142604]|uniref:DMT family transporter n=1 Tax=Pseudonocardia sp. CA-142604 TaxID=3240024 RepID=UPI003D9286AB